MNPNKAGLDAAKGTTKVPYSTTKVPYGTTNVPYGTFLKDVFICSLGAYGGPEAHISVFIDHMVTKKHYLSEEELVELVALCSILPGPTSTQAMVAIGHKMGGPWLAFLTMLVWALPVLVVMTLLSFVYQFLTWANASADILRYVGPMAVGFIVVAAYRIGSKVITDRLTFVLMLSAGLITFFLRAAWVFPLVLTLGGLASIVTSKEKDIWNHVKLNPPWIYLFFFALFALGGLGLNLVFHDPLIKLFEAFYRYGYLVFGGGQVVVPVMFSELVELNQYMTSEEFLTGYGLVQGLPGPMFSFSAYAGGLAARGVNAWYQLAGAVIGGIGIFLPGLLLIYFVYPVWERMKGIRAIKISLKGINAVAGGLIAVAAAILIQKNGLSLDTIAVTLVTILLLLSKRVPAPLIVVATLILGYLTTLT